jgi:cellulose synthase operon protein C
MLSSMEHFFFRKGQAWLVVVALAALAGCSGQDPAATRSQADGSLAKGDFKAAAIQYKNVLQDTPADPLARVGLGRALLAQGDVDGAAIELDRAKSDGADPALFAPWHAAALVEQGELRRVVQSYGDTLLKDPEAQARLMVEVARAWGGLRNAARTEKALNDALAVLPDYPAAKVLLARLKGSKGDLDGAEQLADALVKSSPDRFDVWSLRADLHQARGRDADALAAYERVIELRPTHMQSHVAVLRSRLRAGDSKAADAQLARMQKLAPRHPVTMLVDAELALAKGETVRAREVSQQLLRLFPDDIGILLVAGSAESALGSIVQAAAHFGKALARDPDLDIARENIAAGQIRLGQYGKALETLQPLLARERGTPRGLALAGEAYMRSGRPDAAEPLFRRAVQLAPDEAKLEAAALAARLMSGGGGPVLAQLTDLAQRTDGIDAELALYAAHMSRRNGAAALEAVAAMARKRPQDASVDEMRGTAHRLLGDRAAARNAYEVALKKDPKLFAAVAATVELDMAESRLKQAEDTLRKVIAGERSTPKPCCCWLQCASGPVPSRPRWASCWPMPWPPTGVQRRLGCARSATPWIGASSRKRRRRRRKPWRPCRGTPAFWKRPAWPSCVPVLWNRRHRPSASWPRRGPTTRGLWCSWPVCTASSAVMTRPRPPTAAPSSCPWAQRGRGRTMSTTCCRPTSPMPPCRPRALAGIRSESARGLCHRGPGPLALSTG